MQISSLTSESGMELRDLLSDPAFPQRPAAERDPGREGFALRRLAQLFADSPNALLQELVDLPVARVSAADARRSTPSASPTTISWESPPIPSWMAC
jgi:hypothetical protein